MFTGLDPKHLSRSPMFIPSTTKACPGTEGIRRVETPNGNDVEKIKTNVTKRNQKRQNIFDDEGPTNSGRSLTVLDQLPISEMYVIYIYIDIQTYVHVCAHAVNFRICLDIFWNWPTIRNDWLKHWACCWNKSGPRLFGSWSNFDFEILSVSVFQGLSFQCSNELF